MLIAGIIVAILAATAAGQGTVIGPKQKYWLLTAWLIGVPLSSAMILSAILER